MQEGTVFLVGVAMPDEKWGDKIPANDATASLSPLG